MRQLAFGFGSFVVLAILLQTSAADDTKDNKDKDAPAKKTTTPEPSVETKPVAEPVLAKAAATSLNYNIQIHLPATKDIEVFNAIFKSLREHLIE